MNISPRLFKIVLNWFFPSTCPICHSYVESAHSLCPDCFSKLTFITRPFCNRCGRPFEFETPDAALCGQCMDTLPLYHHARSALKYDEGSKPLILSFKHGDCLDLAPLLVNLMTKADPYIFDKIDIVVPVPLHWKRLLKRRFNQAAVLAQYIAKNQRKSLAPHALKRIKSTKSQGHMKPKERTKNVRNAFVASDKVKGKHILLIDDVMTTGATINACAKALRNAGAHRISVLTLCRVAK